MTFVPVLVLVWHQCHVPLLMPYVSHGNAMTRKVMLHLILTILI